MPFQVAPDIAEVAIHYTREGQNIYNVLHVQKEGGFALSDLQAIASTVNTIVPTVWMPLMATNITYQEVTVRDLSAEDASQWSQSVVGGQPGGKGGNAQANSVSLAVRLKSGLGGRNGSGRLYWPGLADDDKQTANTIKPDVVADIVDAIQQLIDALETIDAIVAILSRYFNNTLRPEGVGFAVNTVSVYDNTVDNQRRRLPGRGT